MYLYLFTSTAWNFICTVCSTVHCRLLLIGLPVQRSPFITHSAGFIQARFCKIQGLLKDFPTVFKD